MKRGTMLARLPSGQRKSFHITNLLYPNECIPYLEGVIC